MNRREQIVEEVANIERELSERVSQDTLVVFHRKLRGLVEYANHHGLPDRKPVELIHHVETRMDEDSLAGSTKRLPRLRSRTYRPRANA